ncbi:MAG: hypothetical protein M9953_05510 [Thermomicrobiales bacterium]|nr:hypothetical protein [Thermomicrobiales bacterium]
MTSYYVGVDGGGTKTAIVIVDDQGNEVTRGKASTSNSAVVGHAKAAETLSNLIKETSASANIELPLAGLWCGLSGSDRPEDHAKLRPAIESLAHEIRLTNDAELAFGALPNEVGVAMVSGTGSIAFGRNEAGVRHRASGWGHIFGDHGSGYDVARKALWHYSAFIDGYGPATSLVDRLTEYWELEEPYALINRVYASKTTKGDIARLSRLVVAEAEAGDDVANAILDQVAADLVIYADTVACKLALGPELDLALVGGMLTQVEPFRDRVLTSLAEKWQLGSVELVTDPALTGARAIAGVGRDVLV